MTRLQIGIIAASLALFCILAFGLETRPRHLRDLDRQRSISGETTSAAVLLKEARQKLPETAAAEVAVMEDNALASASDSEKAERFKELSARWYQLGFPAISGYYAQEVAEILNSGESWAIAGTTYAIGQQQADEEKVSEFCTSRAVQCFENAVSLDPDNPEYQLNLANVYVVKPPQDNPMKGILMLRELNNKYPDNVPVLNTLGRLALQTGQTDRAIERLEQALSLAPENNQTLCLLADAYQAAGQSDKSEAFAQRCQSGRE
ncbi:MAG TPA: tetratricopeptide repeat protein [Flavilitoribacter sp.]|nr:tetratricopeptide repeat protein [Flavilitoribacter sp.]HMQ88069.1 tetratricopeptide repeat protein [Flavilitoribacter sp.]